jgi:hypothetical protein
MVESMEARRERFKRMKRLFLGGWLKGYKEWSGRNWECFKRSWCS